ncbi:MAG: LPS export ABC transporter permease LptG [Gammaproteobacteria bacterium]|jgi:lipopolysaccharide export system permease protein
MKLLDAYIGKTVLFAILMVLLVLVGLDGTFAFLAEMNELEQGYQAPQALLFILMTLPRRIYDFMPVGVLIGCLVGMGSLANTSELTVIRAAGVSIARLVFAAVRPVLWLVVLSLVLGQYVVPQTEQYAQSERARALSDDKPISGRDGFWYREEGQYIHIQAIQPNGVMYGVSRFVFDEANDLVRSDFSRRAIYQGDHWILEEVKQTRIAPEHTESETFQTLRWDTEVTPQVLSIVALKPDYLSITGLYDYATYLKKQALESKSYYFSFWKKVFQPITTVVMVFIAISFIFGPLRSVTMGQRITAGVLVGLMFHYAQQLLGHASLIYDIPPLLGALIPMLVCLVTGVWLLRRV